jgi:hypothetical protein
MEISIKRPIMTGFVLIAAACCAFAVLFPAAAVAAGSISGKVVDAATKSPIEGIEVCAIPSPEDGTLGACAATDSEGHYMIALSPRNYFVVFKGENYAQQYYHSADYSMREAIVVGSEPVTGIDAEMRHFGGIEGLVKEAGSGEPLANVRVCAWVLAGFNRADPCTFTDSTGSYALSNVPPDEYVVEFWPEGNLLRLMFNQKEGFENADPVSVALSEVVTGVDAELPRGAQIAGVVQRVDAPVPPPATLACALHLDGKRYRCADIEKHGNYVIPALPTGEYVVEFFSSFPQEWETQFWDHEVEVEKADPLSLVAGTTVTGIDAVMEHPVPPFLRWARPYLLNSPSSSAPQLAPWPAPVTQAPPSRAPRRCRKGFRRRHLSAGKTRCVRRHRRHHRGHRPSRRSLRSTSHPKS